MTIIILQLFQLKVTHYTERFSFLFRLVLFFLIKRLNQKLTSHLLTSAVFEHNSPCSSFEIDGVDYQSAEYWHIFFSKPKKKKKLWSLEGLRSLSKSHILKMAAPKFLFLKSELILCNIFPPLFFSVYRLSLIPAGWDGADAFKLFFLFVFFKKVQGLNSVPIQWFCFYTLLWCCRAKDLSHVGEMRGPSIRRPTALTDRKPHQDFRCMFEPFCQFAALWLKDVSWCMKYRLSIMNLI